MTPLYILKNLHRNRRLAIVRLRLHHAPLPPAMARAFSPYFDLLTTLYLGYYPQDWYGSGPWPYPYPSTTVAASNSARRSRSRMIWAR